MTSSTIAGLIPLTELPAALRPFADPADAAAQNRIRYQALWTRVCDGTIPAEKVGGRLFAQREKLPDIARALGLTAPAGPKPARAKRVPSNVAAAA